MIRRLVVAAMLAFTVLLGWRSIDRPDVRSGAHAQGGSPSEAPGEDADRTPIFDRPVVPDAVISGRFDHDPAAGAIRFFDGRSSGPGAGFRFACPGIGGAWVGCLDAVTGEENCPDDRELWYDDHHGIDYEYVTDWRTGSVCRPDRFADVDVVVRAPAAGLVDYVGEGHPYNGDYVRLRHDLDGDGRPDGLRSYYLHFERGGVLVDEGQRVEAGDALGYGGGTGLSWTPHLHFEVQRLTSDGWRPVDPDGWRGDGDDPWPVENQRLWRDPRSPSEGG